MNPSPNPVSGLLIGGSVGILYNENRQKVRGARSHAVVRGRTCSSSSWSFRSPAPDAYLDESGVFVANLAFDQPEETRFLPEDVTRLGVARGRQAVRARLSSNLTVTLNSFPAESRPASCFSRSATRKIRAVSMTFGFRQDATKVDAALLDKWAAHSGSR